MRTRSAKPHGVESSEVIRYVSNVRKAYGATKEDNALETPLDVWTYQILKLEPVVRMEGLARE